MRADGHLFAFGWNRYGQCDIPQGLQGQVVRHVAAGAYHSLAVREDGALFAGTYLVPAIDKMLIGLEDKANPYEQILRAIRTVLMTFSTEPAEVQGPFEDDDLVRIGTPHPLPTQKGAIS